MLLFLHLAITCAAPVIIDGSTDCTANTAYDATCMASCNDGFILTGTATLTCGDTNSDGIGDFSALPTCTGILSFPYC